MKGKANIGLIMLLLLAMLLATVVTASAKDITVGSTDTWLNGNQRETLYFSPGIAGSWNCKMSALYMAGLFSKPGTAEFYWANSNGQWTKWKTAELKNNRPVTTLFYSGSSDIKYMIKIYNPNKSIQMCITSNITKV